MPAPPFRAMATVNVSEFVMIEAEGVTVSAGAIFGGTTTVMVAVLDAAV